MGVRHPERLALPVGLDRYRHLPAAEHLRGTAGDAGGLADPLDARLGVRLPEMPQSPQADELERRIRASPVLRPCAADDEQAVTIGFEGSTFSLADARGFALAAPLPARDPYTVDRLVRRLEKRARWRHGLSLENRDPANDLSAELRVGLLRRDASGRWRHATSPEEPGIGQADDLPHFQAGELVALDVLHRFAGELYVYLLDFGLDETVTQLFPPPGGVERLPPRCSVRPGTLAGEAWALWWPDDLGDRDEGLGFFRVLATTQPVDLDGLRTDVARPTTLSTAPAALAWGTVLLPIYLQR